MAPGLPPWDRLIRFIGEDGNIHYGEPELPSDEADIGKSVDGIFAKIIEGQDVFSDNCIVTEKTMKIRSVLGPLTPSDVPTTRCIGLNYAKHSSLLVYIPSHPL